MTHKDRNTNLKNTSECTNNAISRYKKINKISGEGACLTPSGEGHPSTQPLPLRLRRLDRHRPSHPFEKPGSATAVDGQTRSYHVRFTGSEASKPSILWSFLLSYYQRVTHGQTNGETDETYAYFAL